MEGFYVSAGDLVFRDVKLVGTFGGEKCPVESYIKFRGKAWCQREDKGLLARAAK
jgi:hypothetical protein